MSKGQSLMSESAKWGMQKTHASGKISKASTGVAHKQARQLMKPELAKKEA